MLFEKIKEKIWGLSVSAGSSPYTFLLFKVDEELKASTGSNYFVEYRQGIAFFLWEDYTLEDYKDCIIYSKEYLLITDHNQREQFLHQQIAKNVGQKDFLQWQHNQMYIALGFALNEIRGTTARHKVIEPDNLDSFRPSVSIANGVLKEVILF
ncbi:hypothetical protein [Pedobacter nutrimenti]|uniref:hypothetical protein n=1 Tax=Pedobacter nutrimenti TaxID=1241337 RepID=UPI00292F4425|nr:hypothetical protein [Pedobacter nutrimenti]